MSLKDSLKRIKEKENTNIDWRVLAEDIAEKMINEKLIEFQKKTDLLVKELRGEIVEFTNELLPSLKGKPGPKGDSGDNYVLTTMDKLEIAKSIKVPIIEKIVEKTEVIREQPMVTNEIVETAKYETPIQIADKLNTLEEKVEWKVIKGLTKMFAGLSREIKSTKQVKVGGGGMGNIVLFSFNGDGSTTSFTLSAQVAQNGNAILVHYNGQYQHRTVHFTVTNNSADATLALTFTPQAETTVEGWFVRT